MLKKHHLLVLLATCIAMSGSAQSELISGPYTFNIKPKVEPPILNLVSGSLRFVDEDGDGALDALETCSVEFAVTNDGLGDGIGLQAQIAVSGTKTAIACPTTMDLDVATLGKQTAYSIPITSGIQTQDGSITLEIEVTEPNGFGLEPLVIQLETRAFAAPNVKVVDFQLSGSGTLQRKSKFAVQVLVQNIGQGRAEDVSMSLRLPDGVFLLSANDVLEKKVLEAGEDWLLEFDCIINQVYASDEVPMSIQLDESIGKFGSNWSHAFALNEAMSTERLVVRAQATEEVAINIQSLQSDVDRQLPAPKAAIPYRYALVIGNEDYASRSASLEPDVNVDFARNDARSMGKYFEHAFGVPIDQIHVVTDATAAEIRRELNWLSNVARAQGGKAELFFYYSGHGLPAGADQTPYLIPVDVSGLYPEEGIALSEVYAILSEHNSQRVQVILDACFSGGARNSELVAMKGIRVVPRADAIPDGVIVWSSSEGTQASGVNRPQQHGYFTYELLKSLQSEAHSNLGELFNEVSTAVDIKVAKEGGVQTPTAQSAPAWNSIWPALSIYPAGQ